MEVVDAAVQKVAANAEKWHKLEASDKLRYLQIIAAACERLQDEWASLCTKVRSCDGADFKCLNGNGYTIGPIICGFHLSTLLQTYTALAQTGQPPQPVGVREVEGHQVVQVFPAKATDKVFQGGMTAELWLEEGKTFSQGSSLKGEAGVVGVLGAGNYDSPVDILSKMFGENKVVVYKPHPNNSASNAKIFPKIFELLIKDGFLAIVEGGVDVGAALLNHPKITEAIMTGGAESYNRIVWGAPEEQKQNIESGKKVYTKPFEAELGAVSPWIVVPGNWSKSEISHQARYLVNCKMNNASAVCASPQVVVLDREWPQYQTFLAAIREALRQYPPVPVFYPGTTQRVAQLAASSKNSEKFVPPSIKADIEVCHPILIPETDEASEALHKEAFAPVLAIHALSAGGNPAAFLSRAVGVANDVIFGSLSCTLIVDPRTQKQNAAAVETAIKDLKWGAVGVNEWAALIFLNGALRWGALPGRHTPEDIQSGVGTVGNLLLVDNVEKSVLRGVFTSPGHSLAPTANDYKLYARLSRFAYQQRWGTLLPVVSAALVGL